MIKFCKKCQTETDRYKSGDCKMCVSIRAKAWAKANPERHREKAAAWAKANPGKVRVAKAAYYAANVEEIKAGRALYRSANHEKVKAADAAHRAANPDRVKACSKAYRKTNLAKMKVATAAWLKANPEATRLYNQNRRARKLFNGGTLSKGLAKKLYELQKGLCACCGKPLSGKYHLDHIMPLLLGGPNEDSNMQLLLPQCNNQKGAMHPDDFMKLRNAQLKEGQL